MRPTRPTHELFDALRERLADTAAGELPDFGAELERLRVAFVLQLQRPESPPAGAPANGGGDLVDAVEAARILGMSESWVRHSADLPVTRIGRRKLYSRKALERYVAVRTGS